MTAHVPSGGDLPARPGAPAGGTGPTRRGLLDGAVAIAACAAFGPRGRPAPDRAACGSGVPLALPSRAAGGAARAPVDPRGDTPDLLGVPHALRDGRFWHRAGPPEPTGETYDLVVVGGGSGGLAAAGRWARHRPGADVLVLEARERTGGAGDADLLHPPGTAGPPGTYPAVFCDRESFGVDRLVLLPPDRATADWAAELPVAPRARDDLITLFDVPPGWSAGLPAAAAGRWLAGLTYRDLLRDVCQAHPDAVTFCRTMTTAAFGHGADTVSALDAWAASADPHTCPGFAGLGPPPGAPAGGPGPAPAPAAGTVPRVRAGRPACPIRIRLSSPVVLARNDGPPDAARSATVAYFDGHRVRSVRAGAVILTCPHMLVPYLVPDLPAGRRAALGRAVRLPLARATVRLRHGRPWRAAGIGRVRFTGAFWTVAGPETAPGDGPLEVRLLHAPAVPRPPLRVAAAAGRRALAGTPYDVMAHHAVAQLGRLLGPFGFAAGRDVAAVTVHRFGHGPAAVTGDPAGTGAGPRTVRHGRIVIAGSDALPEAGRDAGVRAACRAAADLLDG
ncbi:spermidine dehydrogenase SpdH [Sphaerisporangium rufum]|uniref:Spermidine dehydrogenase SpdH n=1 Tax=Sphaerisporangium rufum TaxID=1381558 RepID=A0A919RB07_9ACTN|nr:NAD(P)-binding protein [Sphaerisporangium rufum]GII80645.1 spermidine dehydrogenase SpdH [Sphaerisporangium rufum]